MSVGRPEHSQKKLTTFCRQIAEYKQQTKMAKQPEANIASVLQLMMQMRTDDREAEQRREDRRIEREEQNKREVERREERLLLALKEAQPAVPQTVTIVNQKLPDMREGEEIETFLGMFEAALRASNVPANQWCAKLHAHLNPSTKLRIQDTIQDPDATYKVIKEALIGCSSMSFSTAAETLLTRDKGKLYMLGHRQCKDKLCKLIEKVTKKADNEKEIYELLAVAFMRHQLHPSLKTYVDLKGEFSSEEFSRTIDEWEATHPWVQSVSRNRVMFLAVRVSQAQNHLLIKEQCLVFTVAS